MRIGAARRQGKAPGREYCPTAELITATYYGRFVRARREAAVANNELQRLAVLSSRGAQRQELGYTLRTSAVPRHPPLPLPFSSLPPLSSPLLLARECTYERSSALLRPARAVINSPLNAERGLLGNLTRVVVDIAGKSRLIYRAY